MVSDNVHELVSRMPAKVRELALDSELLPHEFLLKVCRGEGIKHKRVVLKGKSHELIEEIIYPDFDMRMEAARIAAPYFAPKLSHGVNVNIDNVTQNLRLLADKLPV